MEEQIFRNKQFQTDKLLAFGFEAVGDEYTYQTDFLDGQFTACIRVTKHGEVFGQLFDKDFGEAYTAFRTNQTGAFVGQVRDAYQALLGQIAAACCLEQVLGSAQGRALEAYLSRTYGDSPEEFGRFKGIFTFRHPNNQKWYALATTLPLSKLTVGQKTFPVERLTDTVEVLNIKFKPQEREELLSKPSIYPSYHMNKQHWVTLVLDGGLADEELLALVAESRRLVGQQGRTSDLAEGYWLIPANPKHYDIDQDFAASRFVIWPQKKGVKVGHLVYIYLTAPYRCLRYACRVAEVMPDRQDMVLECLEIFPDDRYPIDFLKQHGVAAVRSTRRLTAALVTALEADKY